MRAASPKTIILLIGLVSLSLLSGCTNWEKKYQALLVEHENLKGQLDWERGEKGKLANRISLDQQTIEEPGTCNGAPRGFSIISHQS